MRVESYLTATWARLLESSFVDDGVSRGVSELEPLGHSTALPSNLGEQKNQQSFSIVSVLSFDAYLNSLFHRSLLDPFSRVVDASGVGRIREEREASVEKGDYERVNQSTVINNSSEQTDKNSNSGGIHIPLATLLSES